MYRSFLILFLLVSCTVTNKRGHYFSDKSKIENFDAYNFTRQDIIDNIGYPSLELDTNVWLYYSYKTKNLNFLKPKIREEDILLVYFDSSDNIVDFSLLKKINTNNIIENNISSDYGEKKNILKQIFDGLNFNPAI